MNQTRLESIIENIINVGSGMLLSMLVWSYIIMPIWGFKASVYDTFGIALIFTIISVMRGYFWRRFFNNGIHKKVHQIVSKTLFPLIVRFTKKKSSVK